MFINFIFRIRTDAADYSLFVKHTALQIFLLCLAQYSKYFRKQYIITSINLAKIISWQPSGVGESKAICRPWYRTYMVISTNKLSLNHLLSDDVVLAVDELFGGLVGITTVADLNLDYHHSGSRRKLTTTISQTREFCSGRVFSIGIRLLTFI